MLARAPRLLLVDESAHTKAPGSRHPKRHQDVEELLAAAIHVYSTANVQHVESLNDVVASFTRVRVRETVPDSILERTEIEVVDIPSDELIDDGRSRRRGRRLQLPVAALRHQDSWQVTPTLGIIYGVRYEWIDSDKPVLNQRFLNAQGFPNTTTPEDGVVQPRFAFNRRPDGRLTPSRGGGLFAGGTPDVWLPNSFSKDGTRQNSLLFQRTATGFVDATQVGALRNIGAALGSAALDNVSAQGVPSVVQRYLAGRGAPVAAAVGTLPDGRPRYDAGVGSNSDVLLRNTDYGRGIVVGAGITKQLGGLTAAFNYTFQNINDVGSYTGFTPTELHGVPTVDPNRAPGGRSSFETRHLGKVQLGYRRNLWADNEFRIDLFGESRSGRPFSHTFTDVTPGRSAVFGTIGGGGRYLSHVPDFSQAAVTNAAGRLQVGNVEFANQAALDGVRRLVDGSGLRRYYGRIAPRNLGTSPSYTKLDLRVQQALPLPLGAKFRVFSDVENVLNLINRNWNTYKVFGGSVSIANAACVADGANSCARYLYSNPNDQAATTFQSASLWQVRIGARVDF